MENIEKKEEFIELRARGLSFQKIAKKLQISKSTLINWSKECVIEINNLRELRVEAIKERFLISQEKKLEVFGVALGKIISEIEERDLSDLTTGQLYKLFFKMTKDLESGETVTLKRQKDPIGELFQSTDCEVWSL